MVFGILVAASPAAGEQAISFRQQIRPIRSTNCFKCHGPDSQSREANLRLDRFEDAVAHHEGHSTLVPGNAESSELYRRITSTDDSKQMPPPESNKHLTEEQRELLRRWINEGGKYEANWAFVRLHGR